MNNYKKCGLICAAATSVLTLISSFLLNGVTLTGPASDVLGRTLTYASWSAGNQWFLITTALFCTIPLLLKWSRKKTLSVLFCFGVVLGTSFVTKTVVKHLTQEPRPYTQTLAELDKVPSSDAFYAVEPLQREEILTEVKDDVSAWRLIHWEGETNYSFPSGHTIFAAAVAIFWGAILMAEGYGLLASLVVGWASVVAASRLWLGMHWAVDVFASIGFAAVICALIYAVSMRLNRILMRREEEITPC